MNSIANIYKAVFLLVASTLIVFAGVDLFYTILQLRSFASEYSPVSVQQEHPAVTGRGSASRAAVDYQVIVSRNLFGEVGAEFEDVQLADVENLQQTSLDLVLLGTIDGDGRARRAIIKDEKEQRQAIYREGDSIQQALVKKILRGKVVLHLRGKDEILVMADENAPAVSAAAARFGRRKPAATAAPPSIGLNAAITLSRSEIEGVINDVKNLRVGVSMRPHHSGGKVDGVMLTEVNKDSFFRVLGLRKNDIVELVNGKPVTSPEETAGLYSTLMAGEPVAMQFKRSGRRQTINYTLKD